jgi:hypothetical protein
MAAGLTDHAWEIEELVGLIDRGAVYNTRMKRFRQSVFTAFAALSLLSCIASASFWVRGEFILDTFTWAGIEQHANRLWLWWIDSVDGEICFLREYSDSDTSAHAQEYARFEQTQFGFHHDARYPAGDDKAWPTDTWLNRLGLYASIETFKFPSGSRVKLKFIPASVHSQRLFIPCWFVTILTAAPVAVWIRGFIKQRKRHEGLFCINCGYDLRATPDRCPECGTIPPRKRKTTSV